MCSNQLGFGKWKGYNLNSATPVDCKSRTLRSEKGRAAIFMKMKTLISTILLIVSVCMRLPLSGADPYTITVWRDCGLSEYRNGSAFQSNLNKVLELLLSNVNPSGFNTSSVVDNGQNSNSTVYGLLQCRGDLNSSDCEQCASTAKARLVEGCHNTSGFIQLDGCFLRYDEHYFYSNYSESAQINVLCNTGNSKMPQQFTNTIKAMLLNIANEAAQSPKFFAADSATAPYNSTENIYSIAQCYRDLSPTDCGACLNSALSKIAACETGAIGSQFGSLNCYLRSELYPFFNTVLRSGGKKSKVLVITLAIAAATVGLSAAIGLWKWIFYRRKLWERISRTGGEEGEINLSSNIANPDLIFKYNILKEATSNFKPENKLGEGGFGSVFKGILPDGREVAVKRLNIGSRQGDVEFLNETNLISRVQHRNLLKLLGCSVENSERLLVYEYLQNSSLDRILFADTTKRHLLDWKKRHEIIVGTARGLAYLHEESEIRIIHRDIKASNILLDNKHRPKIADFGLAKLFAEDMSHVSTRVAGTLGYIAPEYALHGQLTEKADVFSFGVLVLEIISGRKNQCLTEDMEFLIQRAWRLYKTQRTLEVIDPTLEGSYSWEEGFRVIKIGLLCTQAAAGSRPSMSRVVWMLTSERENLPSPTRPAFIDLDSVAMSDQLNGDRDSKTASASASAAVKSSSSILEPR